MDIRRPGGRPRRGCLARHLAAGAAGYPRRCARGVALRVDLREARETTLTVPETARAAPPSRPRASGRAGPRLALPRGTHPARAQRPVATRTLEKLKPSA